MGNRRRLTHAIAALGIVVLTLTGCSAVTDSDGKPAPTSSPATSAPTATATESSTPATPASIVLSVTSIQILDAAGAIMSTHDYFEPAADVASELSEAFGREPTVEHYDGRADAPSGTAYDWDGFALRDGDWPTKAPYYPEFTVYLTAATVGGVTISTTDGVSIGDSFSEVVEAHPAHAEFAAYGDVSLEWTELPPFPEEYGMSDAVPAISVLIVDSEPSGVVSRILAPAANWGA